MKRTAGVFLIISLFCLILPSGARAADSALQSGVPFNTWLDGMTYANGYIDVPAGATRLTVTVTNGDGDLDLYVKYGTALTGTTLGQLEANAEARSNGPTANETIVLTPTTTPPLRAGRWYAATANLNATVTHFTLTATYEVAAQPKIGISPSFLEFGSVNVGETASRTVTISNTGNAALSVASVLLTGANASEFGRTANCPAVASGGTCAITVTFSPSGSGSRAATLVVASNDARTPSLSVPLTGNGVAGKPTGVIPVPEGQRQFAYQVLGPAVRSSNLSELIPVGADCCVAGGKNLGFQIELAQFSGPVDVYLGIFAPVLSGDIFLFTEAGDMRPLSQGVVPWRKTIAGPLSEKLFGDFPAALLPAATYYVLLLVTPADTFDTSYFWIASFVVPGVCVPGDVPVGSAGYVNGKVIAPGAKILHNGTLHEGDYQVSGNALVAVTKGEKVHLYHPALGNAELSDETSRRAVGHFLAGLSVREGGQGLSSSQKYLEPGGTIQLDTGIDVHRTEEGTVEVINKSKRWAAVKTDAGITAYLTPRDSFIPPNVITMFERVADGSVWGFDSRNVRVNQTIETFGSVAKRPFYLWETADSREAYNRDSALFLRLNAVDFIYFSFEAVKQIVSFASPEECVESLVNSGIINTLETVFMVALTSDESFDSGSVMFKQFKAYAYDVLQAAAKCALTAASLVSPSTAATVEGAAQVIDILSAVQWLVDDTVGSIISTTFLVDAYDKVDFELQEKVTLHCTASGNLIEGERGDVTLTCSLRSNASLPPKLTSVVADLSEIGGPGAFHLGPRQTFMTGTVAVTPPGSGSRKIYFRGTDERMRDMTAVAGISVKSQGLSMTGCTASGNLSVGRPGELTVSCTTTGEVASVSADLTNAGGPAAFALTNQGGGAWSGTATLTPKTKGEAAILVTAVCITGDKVTWSTGIAVRGLPSFPATYAGMGTETMTVTNNRGESGTCSGQFRVEISLGVNGTDSPVSWQTDWRMSVDYSVPTCTITGGTMYRNMETQVGSHDRQGNFSLGLFCRDLTGTYDEDELRGNCTSVFEGGGTRVVSTFNVALPRKL